VEFWILGPLEVVHAGRQVPLGEGRQRSVLALALLHRNAIVSTERLIDELWEGSPPPTAAKIVQKYVSQLRRALDANGTGRASELLVTRGRGYMIRVAPDQVDADRFERLLSESRALRRADPDAALEKVRAALDLWRGSGLADVDLGAEGRAEIGRLEDLRLTALEERVDADLSSGRHAELVSELETLVGKHPLRERFRAQLMLALYRCGRQAEALEIYRQTRRLLNAELGIEPSGELRRLEQAILRQEPSLDLPHSARASERPSLGTAWRRPLTRRRAAALTAFALVLIAGAIAAVVAGTRGGSTPEGAHRLRASTLVAKIPVPLPACCGFGFDSVWAAGHHDRTLRRIDPRTNAVVEKIPGVGYQANAVVAAGGSVWVSSRDGLFRINPNTNRIVARLDLIGGPLAFGFLNVWVSTLNNRLVRVDLARNKVVAAIRVDSGATDWVNELAIGFGSVWLARADEHTLLRVDPATNRIVARIHGFGSSYSGMPIAVGEGAVWALRFTGDHMTLFRVDPSKNMVVARIPVGGRGASPPAGTVAVGAGSVWTGNWDSTLSRIDPRSNKVIAVYKLPSVPQNVTFGEGSLWVDSYDASRVWRIEPELSK
jgi:DNA-binding SARP family transcriptional activator/streptogramin lyase